MFTYIAPSMRFVPRFTHVQRRTIVRLCVGVCSRAGRRGCGRGISTSAPSSRKEGWTKNEPPPTTQGLQMTSRRAHHDLRICLEPVSAVVPTRSPSLSPVVARPLFRGHLARHSRTVSTAGHNSGDDECVQGFCPHRTVSNLHSLLYIYTLDPKIP